MKIVWLGYIDPAGASYHYAQYLNNYTEHKCRVISLYETRGFFSDIVLNTYNNGEIDKIVSQQDIKLMVSLLEDADYIIYNGAVAAGSADYFSLCMDTIEAKWPNFNLYDIVKNKPSTVFLHGSVSLRYHLQDYLMMYSYRKWGLITCQTDIVRESGIDYIPNIIWYYHPQYEPSLNKYYEFCTSITDKGAKNFKFIEKLNKFILVHNIEQQRFFDCLNIKKMYSFAIDHISTQLDNPYMYGYCSLSSVENSLLGIINFVYLDKFGRQLIQKTINDNILWHIVQNENEIIEIIEKYLNDPELINKTCIEHAQWARQTLNNPELIKILSQHIEKNYERQR